ncbi:MAG: hypothetical protein CME69_08615 [Halobacteriovorax sp.]|nr:hypothetical protein [Halobacteriovorax sp.]
MQKKIFLSSIIIGICCSILLISLSFYILFDITSSLSSVFSDATSDLLEGIKSDVASHQQRSLKRLDYDFLLSSKNKILKDTETIVPMVNDFSIMSVRDFTNTVFQSDADIVGISVIVSTDNNFTLWSHVSKKLPLGVGFNSKYNVKKKKWEAIYKGKPVELDIDFLSDKNNLKEKYEIKREKEHITIFSPFDSGLVIYKFSLASMFDQIKKERSLYDKIQSNIIKNSDDMLLEIANKKRSSIHVTTLIIIVFIIIIIIFNYLLAKKIGEKISEPVNSLLDSIKKVAQGEYEEHAVIKSGDEIEEIANNFNLMVMAIKDRDSQLHEYQNNLENILSQRTRELEEERAKNIQESKLRSIGEMSAGIAHEINNPLATIDPSIKIVRMLLDKEPPDKEKISKRLDVILEMTARISEIVKGVTTFARDQVSVDADVVEVSSIISSSLNMIEKRAKKNDITIDLINTDKSINVFVKKNEIIQVLINLLNNAYYEVDKLEDKKERWIKIESYEDESKAIIRVLNGGDKIKEDIVEKIMAPFFTTKPEGEGTGLGLSVSRGIMKSYNGDLEVDLKEESTCFVMTLPKVRN